MAQRITRLTTDQKIAGSNPAEVEEIFFDFFSQIIHHNYLFLKLLFQSHELLHVVFVLLRDPLLHVLDLFDGALVLLPVDGRLAILVRVQSRGAVHVHSAGVQQLHLHSLIVGR